MIVCMDIRLPACRIEPAAGVATAGARVPAAAAKKITTTKTT
jgi:hypothetical protein